MKGERERERTATPPRIVLCPQIDCVSEAIVILHTAEILIMETPVCADPRPL